MVESRNDRQAAAGTVNAQCTTHNTSPYTAYSIQRAASNAQKKKNSKKSAKLSKIYVVYHPGDGTFSSPVSAVITGRYPQRLICGYNREVPC